ncbi:hypothetical protein IZU99_05545 [Oscillospiraceae bacterium CM]|nr:hypothetical protein IZU99_05545 [Oscillospiraceae bacterium CM]
MKKFVSATLSVILLLSLTIPASASERAPTEKEEVVYAILGLDGQPERIDVVNIFNTGDITDYGDYLGVENLTNADPITQNGDQMSVSTSAQRFYYQGTPKAAVLPWNFAITYTLDGSEIAPSALAGASGTLSIHIRVSQNPKADSSFFLNDALQIALSLNTELCQNIVSEGATVADAGADKQLSYIVLPGKGADITVTADVHDLEMAAMSFNGIRLVLNMDVSGTALTGQLGKLADAIAGLDDGAAGLQDGVRQLSDGMTQYLDSLNAFNSGFKDLSDGASQLASGISGLETGLKDLASQNDAFVAGALASRQAAFDSANTALAGAGLPQLTPENYSEVLSANAAFAEVKSQLDGVVSFADGIIAYTDGVSRLASGASDLSSGAQGLDGSLSQMAAAAQGLYDGGVKLSAAISSLKEGISEYKSGTAQLRDGTKDMKSDVAGQIDDLLLGISGSDAVKSFVSPKNTNVTSVQFVFKTGTINIPEKDTAVSIQENNPTFWEKLLALFGMK